MNPRSLLVGVLLGLLAALASGWRPGRSSVPGEEPNSSTGATRANTTEGAANAGLEPAQGLDAEERAELEQLRAWTDTREQELLTELDQAFSRYEQQLLANLPLTPQQPLGALASQAAPQRHQQLRDGGSGDELKGSVPMRVERRGNPHAHRGQLGLQQGQELDARPPSQLLVEAPQQHLGQWADRRRSAGMCRWRRRRWSRTR